MEEIGPISQSNILLHTTEYEALNKYCECLFFAFNFWGKYWHTNVVIRKVTHGIYMGNYETVSTENGDSSNKTCKSVRIVSWGSGGGESAIASFHSSMTTLSIVMICETAMLTRYTDYCIGSKILGVGMIYDIGNWKARLTSVFSSLPLVLSKLD